MIFAIPKCLFLTSGHITRGGGIMVGNRIGGSRAILKGCYITHNYAAREGGVLSVVDRKMA